MAKRRRRLKKSVKVVLGIILISLVGLLVFLIYSNTSKYLFFKGISKSSNEVIDICNDLLSQYMPFYEDFSDLIFKIESYLEDKNAYNTIVENCYKIAKKSHNSKDCVRFMLETVK